MDRVYSGLVALGVGIAAALSAGCERGALQRLDAGGSGASDGGRSTVGAGGTSSGFAGAGGAGAGGGPDAGGDGPILVGRRAPGEACVRAVECASGFCTDGVCCRSACVGACRTCAAPSASGTCVIVAPDIADPHGVCRDEGAARCGQNGKCDGAGACKLYPPGTECQSGACASDALVSRQVCDGNGACKPGPTEICAPFTCDPARRECFSTCTSSAECVQGRACAAGSCRVPPKLTCGRDEECSTGHCVDSVCCNAACPGPCLSCAVPEHLGTCYPIPPGAPDPRGLCRTDPPASCGQNGTCTGGGQCAEYPVGSICKPSICEADSFTPAGVCDGHGACAIPTPLSCLPSHCAGSACSTPCLGD